MTVMQKYKTVKQLGRGAFGTVFVSEGRKDNKEYVVKVIDSLRQSSLKIQEIRILASFQHKHIVEMQDFYASGSNLCIVMEYCRGGDLRYRMAEARAHRKHMSEDKILTWIIQILHGLEYMHNQQVAHRDLKPSNVFIDDDGVLKIGDFGVAQVMFEKVIPIAVNEGRTGTKKYMAPEVLHKMEYSTKVDIWSLGCILYEMVTLTPPPYEDKGRFEFDQVPTKYSRIIHTLLRKCLHERPDMRPSASEILTQYLAPQVEKLCPAPPPDTTKADMQSQILAVQSQSATYVQQIHSLAGQVQALQKQLQQSQNALQQNNVQATQQRTQLLQQIQLAQKAAQHAQQKAAEQISVAQKAQLDQQQQILSSQQQQIQLLSGNSSGVPQGSSVPAAFAQGSLNGPQSVTSIPVPVVPTSLPSGPSPAPSSSGELPLSVPNLSGLSLGNTEPSNGIGLQSGRQSGAALPAASPPMPSGPLGMILDQDSRGAVVVRNVEPGSVAAVSGEVMPGDIVHEVNGYNVYRQSPAAWSHLLENASAPQVRLALQRGRAKRLIHVVINTSAAAGMSDPLTGAIQAQPQGIDPSADFGVLPSEEGMSSLGGVPSDIPQQLARPWEHAASSNVGAMSMPQEYGMAQTASDSIRDEVFTDGPEDDPNVNVRTVATGSAVNSASLGQHQMQATAVPMAPGSWAESAAPAQEHEVGHSGIANTYRPSAQRMESADFDWGRSPTRSSRAVEGTVESHGYDRGVRNERLQGARGGYGLDNDMSGRDVVTLEDLKKARELREGYATSSNQTGPSSSDYDSAGVDDVRNSKNGSAVPSDSPLADQPSADDPYMARRQYYEQLGRAARKYREGLSAEDNRWASANSADDGQDNLANGTGQYNNPGALGQEVMGQL